MISQDSSVANRLFFILIITFLLCSGFANGQFRLKGLGAGLGGNRSEFEHTTTDIKPEKTDPRLGFNTGIEIDFGIAQDWLEFNPSFYFIQNGTKDYYSNLSQFIDSLAENRVRFDYIGLALPLTAYIGFGEEKHYNYNGISINGSFYVDYAFKASSESELGSTDEVEFNSGSDQFDYGLDASFDMFFGGGIQIRVGYRYGIQNIEFFNPASPGLKQVVSNRGLYVSIGYRKLLE
jgi:hypothetical protein